MKKAQRKAANKVSGKGTKKTSKKAYKAVAGRALKKVSIQGFKKRTKGDRSSSDPMPIRTSSTGPRYTSRKRKDETE